MSVLLKQHPLRWSAFIIALQTRYVDDWTLRPGQLDVTQLHHALLQDRALAAVATPLFTLIACLMELVADLSCHTSYDVSALATLLSALAAQISPLPHGKGSSALHHQVRDLIAHELLDSFLIPAGLARRDGRERFVVFPILLRTLNFDLPGAVTHSVRMELLKQNLTFTKRFSA